jgi:hypothetical protein
MAGPAGRDELGADMAQTAEPEGLAVPVADARPGSDVVAELPAGVRSGRTWQELAGE